MFLGLLKSRLALAGLLLFAPIASAQYEGDMPPDDGEAIYDGGAVAPYQPDEGSVPDPEMPQATDDFRGSQGGAIGGGDSRPAFTGGNTGNSGGGSNFGGGNQRKVEFRLLKEGNLRYNTNRKPRTLNY